VAELQASFQTNPEAKQREGERQLAQRVHNCTRQLQILRVRIQPSSKMRLGKDVNFHHDENNDERKGANYVGPFCL
jgi:hypothetical protein